MCLISLLYLFYAICILFSVFLRDTPCSSPNQTPGPVAKSKQNLAGLKSRFWQIRKCKMTLVNSSRHFGGVNVNSRINRVLGPDRHLHWSVGPVISDTYMDRIAGYVAMDLQNRYGGWTLALEMDSVTSLYVNLLECWDNTSCSFAEAAPRYLPHDPEWTGYSERGQESAPQKIERKKLKGSKTFWWVDSSTCFIPRRNTPHVFSRKTNSQHHVTM